MRQGGIQCNSSRNKACTTMQHMFIASGDDIINDIDFTLLPLVTLAINRYKLTLVTIKARK